MAAAILRKIFETPYWAFYAALLILGAWAGIWTAGLIPFEVLSSPEKAAGAIQASPLPANGQRNLLLIGVDSLEGDTPVLESLWLVLYFPGRSPITLLPLYPHAGSEKVGEEVSLQKAFSLASSGAPSPAFFDRLRSEQVWWNGFILLDGTAAAALLDQIGGVDLNGQQLDARRALDSLPRAEQDEAGALAGQVRLLRLACVQASKNASKWPEAALQAGDLGPHFRTDLEVSRLVQDWLQAAGEHPMLECEFPLLDAP